MSFGGLQEYFGGLERVVGRPSANVSQAMEDDLDFDVKAAMRKVDNDILAKAKSSMPSQSKPTPRARPDPRGVPKSLVIGRGGDCVEYWHGRCKLSAADCEYKHE